MNIKNVAPHALPYNTYRYLWPPRPELKLPADKLPDYDDGRFLGQPKLNGSNTLVFIHDSSEFHIKNRHNQDKTGNIKLDLNSLYRGAGWMVLNGEWMEKSKMDETGKNFNGNFVVFDILVYNSFILTGSTFQNRLHLLNDLYGTTQMQVNASGLAVSKEHLFLTGTNNVCRVATYEDEFKVMYNLLTPIDMFEGLVLKRKDAPLALPITQTSNSKWMIKIRKETKIYKF